MLKKILYKIYKIFWKIIIKLFFVLNILRSTQKIINMTTTVTNEKNQIKDQMIMQQNQINFVFDENDNKLYAYVMDTEKNQQTKIFLKNYTITKRSVKQRYTTIVKKLNQTLNDNLKQSILSLLQQQIDIKTFIENYVNSVNPSKLDERKIFKHISLLIAISILYYDLETQEQKILSAIDYILKKFPNIYKKIIDLYTKYYIRYKEVINRLEHHMLTLTVESELYTIFRDLFISALMEEKYLYEEFGFGLINNIFGKLFSISGSKKVTSNVFYTEQHPDYISLKSNDVIDILVNNESLNKLMKLKSKNLVIPNFKLNRTFISFVALPFINNFTEYYISYHNADDVIIYNILEQYFDSYSFIKQLLNSLGRIQGPELIIYDNLNQLRNSICGTYYNPKTKTLYFNDINYGFHKIGQRTLNNGNIIPGFKVLQHHYALEPIKLTYLMSVAIYVHYYDRGLKDVVIYNFVKFLDML